jgi:hypothetical protein
MSDVATGAAYTAGRVCAIATRPLCLFIANNLLSAIASQGLAIAFLASAAAIMGIAASPDRRFYSRYFARETTPINGVTFYIYAGSLLILTGVGVVIVCVITGHFTRSLALMLSCVVYFISEKVVDEIQRLRLFERDFGTWGRSSIVRTVLQLIGFAIVLLIGGQSIPAWGIVLALTVGNLVVFLPQLPKGLRSSLFALRAHVLLHMLSRAARSLLQSWMLWVIALLSAGIVYLDRFVALVLDPAVLPLFMLIVMCFSVVQMAVDFYYVSRHRRDFLERRIAVAHAFTSREFLLSTGVGLALALLASLIALHFSRGGAEFPAAYVAIIAFLQVTTAVAAIPREVLYWSHLLQWILRIELLFWLLFACAAVAGWYLHLQVTLILVLVSVCTGVRLLLLIVAGSRSMKT